MREKFLGYYKPTQEELSKLWKGCIFVFDTSVLLNIYRYTSETREDLFKLLEKVKNRIWIPYQVAFEFHEQRENVINQQNTIYEDIAGIMHVLQRKVLEKYKKGHPFADIGQIKGIFEKAISETHEMLQNAQANHPNLLSEDIHLERLTTLLTNKIGDDIPKDKLNKIYEEGQQRYKEKIPPGYEDQGNKDGIKPFGDLVLWYQIIEYAKLQKKSIIFITDDAKEDWWRQDRDGKILGPRPELIQEFHNKAKEAFYMYLADEFIAKSQTFLDVQVNQNAIEEAREVRESTQAMQAGRADYDRWHNLLLNEFRSPKYYEEQFFTRVLKSLIANEPSRLSRLTKNDREKLYMLSEIFSYLPDEIRNSSSLNTIQALDDKSLKLLLEYLREEKRKQQNNDDTNTSESEPPDL